jgi:signal transduction histidine kinase
VNNRANETLLLPLLWGSFLIQVLTGWAAVVDTTPLRLWLWISSQVLLAIAITWWWRSQTAVRRKMQARLDAAAKVQLRSAAVQARFIDHLAHEIKTPLTVVVNRAEILNRCSQDANAVRAHAKELAEYILNYSHLVDAFLRLASPAPAPCAEQHAAVHMYDLVLEAVRRLQQNARNRGVSITAIFAEPEIARNTPGNATVEVMGDERLLLAMVEHLLRHAVRSAPRNTQLTVQVDVPLERVIVQVHSSARVPLSQISASGPEACFSATEPAPERAGDASFDICRRIAFHHGGELKLPESPGSNFEFAVTLPRWREATSPLAPADAKLQLTPSDGGTHATAELTVKETP